jgi:hypothetical protein
MPPYDPSKQEPIEEVGGESDGRAEALKQCPLKVPIRR